MWSVRWHPAAHRVAAAAAARSSTAHTAAAAASTFAAASASRAWIGRPPCAIGGFSSALRSPCASFATHATTPPASITPNAAAATAASSSGDPSTAAPSTPRLPPTARLLYKSLLRTAQRFDRLPGLKAALVHPACEGLENLQESANDAEEQGQAVLASLAAEIARGQVGAAGARQGKHAPGINTAVPASQMALAASLQRAHAASITSGSASPSASASTSSPYSFPAPASSSSDRDSPFPLISARISREWAASVAGPQVPLGDKLYWRWMDRFFRRKKQKIIVGETQTSAAMDAPPAGAGGNKKARKAATTQPAAESAVKPALELSAREIALPSPPGTIVPFYYLPSRSLVASVRSEFRAFTRTPTAQQWTHILSGGFQVLRYLNEHEKQLEDLIPQLESIGAHASAGVKPVLAANEIDPTQIDPALSFSPFGPPFYPAGSQQLHTTLLDAHDLDMDDDAMLLSDHARADADALRVDDNSTAAGAAAAPQPDSMKEQFEVDLDAMQADIKKEREVAAAAATATPSTQADAPAPPAAPAVAAVPVTDATVSAAPTPSASPSSPPTPLPAVPQPLTWPLRPTRHLRAGSFLVAHPALSSPEFHQAVLLITRFDLQADIVEAVLINRPMERETLRARSLLEKRDGQLLAAGAAALARERRGLRAEQRKKLAAKLAQSPTTTPAEKATAAARAKLLAALDEAADPADPRSYRHHFVPEWDVAALESRFPGAAMFGGPVARRAAVAGAEDEDDGAPLILHRRPDWQSGMGGSIALQKLAAKQPPLIPALTATDPNGHQQTLAPPVFVANLKQWTPFLQWTGQDKMAPVAADQEQSKAEPSAASEQESVPDTADELFVADDAERDETAADRDGAQLELDELFALYPPPPRRSRGLSRRAMQERQRAQEKAWEAEEEVDRNTPWPASVLNKSTRAEWTALPGSQTASVSLPLLPPATFPTIAATPAQLASPAAAVTPTPAETPAPAVIPTASPSASLTALADSIPVSSLRSWDFLLFFGCSSWTPRALRDEIEEGTWFLMEGNAHHIFNQHTHIPLPGEAEAEAAVQAEKQKQAEADEARRAQRVKELLGDDTAHDEQAVLSKVLADTESELLQQGLARPASATTFDVQGKTVSAEPVGSGTATASPASVPAVDAELRSLVESLQSRFSDLYAEFHRLSSRLTLQQQKNILRLLTAPTAAAADPTALREALHDFVAAAVKITSALEESRAIVLPEEQEEKEQESAAPLVSMSDKLAAKRSLVSDHDASADDEKVVYPDPLSQRMQQAFSTPVIPQAVYTAIMAHHMAAAQQGQAGSTKQSALPASSAASSATESSSSALVPLPSSAAAASALAALPLSLPPVLFPWQRLWHHALWQLGGEARSWAYLPHQPFENEAALHDEETDEWENDDPEEDDDDENEWDDDDEDGGNDH